jgi:hypothetical protein
MVFETPLLPLPTAKSTAVFVPRSSLQRVRTNPPKNAQHWWASAAIQASDSVHSEPDEKLSSTTRPSDTLAKIGNDADDDGCGDHLKAEGPGGNE